MTRLELHDLQATSPQLEDNFSNVFVTILEMEGISGQVVARR